MKAFFVTFSTTLSPQKLAAKRKRLRGLLADHKIELSVLKVGAVDGSTVNHIVERARGCPVIVLDDRHALPGRAPWLADLRSKLADMTTIRRPQVVYVTSAASAAGLAQDANKELICGYIKRDNIGRWVDDVAALTAELALQLRAAESSSQSTWLDAEPPIVGQSASLNEAIEDLTVILHQPYGLVTGDAGVGKMYIIRSLWRQIKGCDAPFLVLPCGSFFKDYYVMGIRRRFGGGRQAVDDLERYLEEANDGLLVLHHIHLLPTALQEELLARLASVGGGGDNMGYLRGIDKGRLSEHNIVLMGTSSLSIEQLREPGRLVPDLIRKLRKRHVRIPTLSERGDSDVRLLCQDILLRICAKQKIVPPKQISAAALKMLGEMNCPNNISDLTAVIEHAVRRCRDRTIGKKHLSPRITAAASSAATLDEIVARAQRTAIQNALDASGGNVSLAAQALGRNRAGLYRLMRKLGMRPGD